MSRPAHERWLLAGGLVTGLASLLHVAIIIGGPDWYRFFGAGERMARLAAQGSPSPPLITASIAAMLAVWTLYAFSGARVIRRLPFVRPVLVLIAAVYILRGALGVPIVQLVDDPYMKPLRGRPGFMIVSSVTCLGLGLCYALGAAGLSKRRCHQCLQCRRSTPGLLRSLRHELTRKVVQEQADVGHDADRLR